MAKSAAVSSTELRHIKDLVTAYLAERDIVELFGKQVRDALAKSKALSDLVHSIRFRIKDPDHLEDKLIRKLRNSRAEGRDFDINRNNLFTSINDLAGVRLLHLHTSQIEAIDQEVKKICGAMSFEIREGPFARTWDDESREYFSKIGIETQSSPTMYTSVHYVVTSNSRQLVTCEIQVRTLMEEVWGEVDHSINYPHKIDSIPCREQILALARSTSAATRLVDSIFASVADHKTHEAQGANKKQNAMASKKIGRRG